MTEPIRKATLTFRSCGVAFLTVVAVILTVAVGYLLLHNTSSEKDLKDLELDPPMVFQAVISKLCDKNLKYLRTSGNNGNIEYQLEISARDNLDFHKIVEYLAAANCTSLFFTTNQAGATLLHQAVKHFDVLNKTLEIFHSNRTTLNAIDNNGDSVLFYAIAGERNTSFLTTLMHFGANWDISNNYSQTALHCAALTGKMENLELFISLGKDKIMAKDSHNRTFLHLAANNKSKCNYFDQIVEHLNIINCTVSIFNQTDEFGAMALHYAVRRLSVRNETLKILFNNSVNINAVDIIGNSVLFYAIEGGRNEPFLVTLVGFGANVTTVNVRNETVLHQAVNFYRGQFGDLKFLITAAKDVIDRKDLSGRTFLHVFAARTWRWQYISFKEIIGFMHSNKSTSSFSVRDNSRNTVLHYAVWSFPVLNETLEIFRNNSVDFNAINVDSVSVLFYAIQGDRDEVFLNTLMNFGADWRIKDNRSNTVLHNAAAFGNLPAVKLFIALGADVDAVDADGNTPLHSMLLEKTVCKNGYKIVSELVNHNAKLGIRNKFGKTPLELARETPQHGKKNSLVVDLIETASK